MSKAPCAVCCARKPLQADNFQPRTSGPGKLYWGFSWSGFLWLGPSFFPTSKYGIIDNEADTLLVWITWVDHSFTPGGASSPQVNRPLACSSLLQPFSGLLWRLRCARDFTPTISTNPCQPHPPTCQVMTTVSVSSSGPVCEWQGCGCRGAVWNLPE